MYCEYPKCKYHPTKKDVIVKSPEEEAALGIGWADKPLDRYPGPKPSQNDPRACLKWVDDWPVPKLSANDRNTIKAHFLKTEAAFWKLPGDPSMVAESMQGAFSGVAEVLWDAGILSEALLEKEVPELVWDTAAAAGWWPWASETYQGISGKTIGHYLVWWDESSDWQGLFRGVTAEWLARLVEAESQTARTRPNAADRQPQVAQKSCLDTARINQWILEEGYNNQELADKLHISRRVVSSMRNNQKYHGRQAVEKLAKLMELDATALYLFVE